MSGPEARITKKILEYLRTHCWVRKIHGGPYQSAGLPDIIACRGGQMIAIEVKAPGGKLTAIQSKTLDELRTAGAIVAVVTSVVEVDCLLRLHDEQLHSAWARARFEHDVF